MPKPATDLGNRIAARHPGSTFVRRGRNFVEYQRPDGKFVQKIVNYPLVDSAGAEIDTDIKAGGLPHAPWLWVHETADTRIRFGNGNLNFNNGQLFEHQDKATGETINLQPQDLQWVDINGGLYTAGTVATLPGVINGNQVEWTAAYGVGRHFKWIVNPERLHTFVTVDSLTSLPNRPANVDFLRVQFILQKSNGLNIWVNGNQWDERVNNPQQTSGPVEFKTAGGQVVFRYIPAFAYDSRDPDGAGGAEQYAPGVTTYVRKTGPNLFIEVRIPAAWLIGATYPVVIDPTTNKEPSKDTGGQKGSPTTNYSTAVSYAAKELAGSDAKVAWIKWDISSIPGGSTIDDTELTITTQNAKEGSGSSADFHIVLRNWVDTEATWNIYSTGNNWTTAGGSGTGDREASSIATYGNWPSYNANISFVPSGMALGNTNLTQAVQDWLDGTKSNYGLHYSATALANTTYEIHSSEATTASYRPDLEIVYTEGSGAAPVDDGRRQRVVNLLAM